MAWRTPTSLIPSGRGMRSCRGMGRARRGRACFDTGALRPAQHEVGGETRFSRKGGNEEGWRGEPQRPSSRAGRGTRSCRGMGRGTADALRASTRARCARLSMRLVGEKDSHSSEAMRRVAWRTPTSLIPSGRGTRSCRGMGRGTADALACFDTGALRPAQHEVGGETRFSRKGGNEAGWSGEPQRPSSRAAAGRGRVEGWAGARPTPCGLRHGRAAPGSA